jgi:hypothetical protein
MENPAGSTTIVIDPSKLLSKTSEQVEVNMPSAKVMVPNPKFVIATTLRWALKKVTS